MARISIEKFNGEATGVTPRQIPVSFAQFAQDTDTKKGTLRGIRDYVAAGESVGRASPETIFRYRRQHWFSFADDVDIVRAPIESDPYQRIYWTGNGKPKMASIFDATAGGAPHPSQEYDLGVPAPSASIVPDVHDRDPQGNPITPPDTAVDTSYVHTYVTDFGEEGPPSLPSAIVRRWDEDAEGYGWVLLDIPAVEPNLNLNIVSYRIYRTEIGGSFNFVAEVPVGTAEYEDHVFTDQLLTELVSTDYDPPPANMIGLIEGPAGSLMGFVGNTVCISEPAQPHAWPVDYRIALDDDVVGMAKTAAGVVVATEGKPVLLLGSTPESMDKQELDIDQAGISKRSVVDMGRYGVYASPEGLVAVGQDGARMLTEELLEREEWRELNPRSIRAYKESDRYLMFYETALGEKRTMAFTPSRGFERITGWYRSAYYDKYDDILFAAAENGDLMQFDQGDRRSYQWKSGIFEAQPGTQPTCGKIVAAGYPVTIKAYFDETLQWSLMVISNRPFRCPVAPAGANIREWQFEILSDQEVFSVQIAQSMEELL